MGGAILKSLVNPNYNIGVYVMHDCVVMDEVSFTVYLGALTTLIPLALGCGRIPTSEDGLLMHYRGICEECELLLSSIELHYCTCCCCNYIFVHVVITLLYML